MTIQRFVLIDGQGGYVNTIECDPSFAGTDAEYQAPEGLTLVPEADYTPPPPPDPTSLELKAYASAKRFAIQTGGVTSQTYGPLLTDRDTTAIIGQAIQSIDLGIAPEPTNFKTPSGFFPLMRSDLIAISTAIVAHVQACFDKEGEVAAAIDANAITTIAEIDAEFAEI